MAERFSYVESELSKIKVGSTPYTPTLKVFANTNGSDTKHLSLSKENAVEIVKWLTENFINK